MENFFTVIRAAKEAQVSSSQNTFQGKRNYFPPMAICLKVDSMTIMVGSTAQSSPSGGWEVNAKEVDFDDMNLEQDLTFDSYTEKQPTLSSDANL